MIQVVQKENMFFVLSDTDLGQYGPFDSLWAKGVFFGKEFVLDTTELKSWKHAVGIFQNRLYFLQEINSKIEYFTK